MEKPAHIQLSDLNGFQQLANDAVLGLTDLVETMHHTIARGTAPLGKPPAGRTAGITGLAYKSVRGVTRLVGFGLDALLGTLAPLLAKRPSSEQREAAVAVLNGLFGDHLDASGNPLAIDMRMRRDGSDATGKVVVLVHGLCMNDRQWTRAGHDHGAALARDLGYTPVYIRYNSGRHISTNGRELAESMQALLREWPLPVERLAIVAHSMGGLVARSACHYGAAAGHAWPKRLDDIVFLGTPHHGAPLERAGALVDLLMEVSPYSAPFSRLGKARSAGIKDLSHGLLRDEDWKSRSRARSTHLPLPDGVRCHAVAASRQERASARDAGHRGDGLVPVPSALGRHADAERSLRIQAKHRVVVYGAGHFDLLSRAEVYERVKAWLGEATPREVKAAR
jgi:pimeloyl-ACP methyl ester carboxylesterase